MSTHTKSSTTGWILGGVAAVAIIAGLIIFTDVDLTSTGELPEVSVEGGEMPGVDVDVADVDVGSKEVTVEVPTVDVDLPKEGEEADDLADNIDVDVDANVDADVDVDAEVEPDTNQ